MMKKLLFIFLSVFLTATFVNAQDLTLSWNGKPIGDTLVVFGDANAAEIVSHAVVTNNTSKEMNVKVSRDQIYLVEGALSQFCWGLCYDPLTDVSPQYYLLQAGESSPEAQFSGHYLPQTKIGNTIVQYNFFNMDNIGQSVSMIVKYMGTPAGIAEEAMANGTVSDLYPNPATNFVTLDYQLTNKVNSAEVKIYNLMGSELKSTSLENNGSKLRLDISELKNGIYFYSILVNNDVYQTKKLVVQR